MAAMIAAAVAAALMVLIVMMVMMIAMGVRIVGKISFSKRLRRLISVSGHTGIKLNACFSQRHLRSHADTAADQSVSLGGLKKARKGAMTGSVCIHNLRTDDFSVFNVIKFKLFRSSKVLEDFPLIIGNCNTH